jgi:metallo-beta-lactamase family protein
VKITSYGAAGEVTGSCHLLETDDLRLLVDCGLFQGRDEEERNRAAFPFDPSSIDAVLLTHGHLDHCGRLPLLPDRGFRGEILCTQPTRDVAKLILMDSAHLQTEDAARRRRHARREGKEAAPPLYRVQDVVDLEDRFGTPARYDHPIEISPSVTVTFRDAGHVLGSAFVRIDGQEGAGRRSVVFSGDLGHLGQHSVADPASLRRCDLAVVESTYGDRSHRSVSDSVAELMEIVRRTLDAGGNVLIPTFALERAQDILFHLGEARRAGRIPKAPVFLDSPLAINLTRLYRKHEEYLDDRLRDLIDRDVDPFHFDGVEFTRSTEESKEINHAHGAVILAGSGMCQGGRIVHHLRHNLWREEAAVVIVGYQARGTVGRRLIEGAKSIRLHGRDIAVRASIHTVGGFSAHADRDEILQWLEPCRGERALLIHGEDRALESLRDTLSSRLDMDAEIARPEQSVTL